MNNIDKLFKNKLEGHIVVPSVKAWKKVESQLSEKKKNKGVIWMSIAATVTIIMISIAYFNINTTNDTPTQIALSSPNNRIDENQITDIETPTKLDSKTDIAWKEAPPKTTPASKIISIKRNLLSDNSQTAIVEITTNTLQDTTSTDNTAVVEKKTVTNLNNDSESLLAVNENPIQKEYLKNSSVKIIYNLQPAVKIDSSILNKKTTNSKAKNNMLGKIVAFAKNAKTSEVSLGNLRAAKDDFLSLDNFRKQQHTQK